MSVATLPHISPSAEPCDPSGLRMNADEFFALGETRERFVLIDGVVIFSPSPNFRHQRISFLIAMQIEEWSARGGGAQCVQDVDVRLSDKIVYQPDISVFRAGRVVSDTDPIEIAPDLVIEVLSPGSRALDLVTKRDDYERFGVAEYWVIDPAALSVQIWRREGQLLCAAGSSTGTIVSQSLPGLVLDLTRLGKR